MAMAMAFGSVRVVPGVLTGPVLTTSVPKPHCATVMFMAAVPAPLAKRPYVKLLLKTDPCTLPLVADNVLVAGPAVVCSAPPALTLMGLPVPLVVAAWKSPMKMFAVPPLTSRPEPLLGERLTLVMVQTPPGLVAEMALAVPL